jgi:hypothetical protein
MSFIDLSREAQRVTNETLKWFSEARFHPSGTKVIATKRYTGRSSLGAGEGWEYSVPSVRDLREGLISTIEPGSGVRRVSRSLPRGWTSEEYNNQQIGPEQLIWNGDDSIIYSKDVKDPSVFDYRKGKTLSFRRICTTLRGKNLCFNVTRRSHGHICYIRAQSHLWHNQEFGRCISGRRKSSRAVSRSTHPCICTPC